MKHLKKFENFTESDEQPELIDSPGFGTPCGDCNCYVEDCKCGCETCKSKQKKGVVRTKISRRNDFSISDKKFKSTVRKKVLGDEVVESKLTNINEGIGTFLVGGILAIGLYRFFRKVQKLYKIYISEVPDDRAVSSDDDLSKQLLSSIRNHIQVGRSKFIEAIDNGTELIVNSSMSGKKELLFSVNKDSLIMKGRFGSKTKLTKELFDELSNMVYWYRNDK